MYVSWSGAPASWGGQVISVCVCTLRRRLLLFLSWSGVVGAALEAVHGDVIGNF